MEISKKKGSMRQSMRVYMVSKRILDIVLSLCALLILSPIFLAVFMIDCFGENKGPIFYKQVRIGLHGKPFKIIKFRSMIIDANKKLRKDPKLYHEYKKIIINFLRVKIHVLQRSVACCGNHLWMKFLNL